MKKNLIEKEKSCQIKAKKKISQNNTEKKPFNTLDKTTSFINLRKTEYLRNNANQKKSENLTNFDNEVKIGNHNINSKDNNYNDDEYFITKLKKLKQTFPSNKKELSKNNKTSDKINNNKFLNIIENTIGEPINNAIKTSNKNKKKAIKIKKLKLSLKKNLNNETEMKSNYKISRDLSSNTLNNISMNSPYSLYVFNNPINLNYNNFTLNESNNISNNYSYNSKKIYSFRLSPIIDKKTSVINYNEFDLNLYNNISPKLYSNVVFRKTTAHDDINYNKKNIKDENKIESHKINIGKLLKNTRNEESNVDVNNIQKEQIYFSTTNGNHSRNTQNNQNIINISTGMSNNNKNRSKIYYKPISKPKKLRTSPYRKKYMVNSNKKTGNNYTKFINSYTKMNICKYKKSFNTGKNYSLNLGQEYNQININSPIVRNYNEFTNDKKAEKNIFSPYSIGKDLNKIKVNRIRIINNKSLNLKNAIKSKKINKNIMDKIKIKSQCFIQKYYKYNLDFHKKK